VKRTELHQACEYYPSQTMQTCDFQPQIRFFRTQALLEEKRLERPTVDERLSAPQEELYSTTLFTYTFEAEARLITFKNTDCRAKRAAHNH
jgi:hypothetical protein